MSWQSWALAFVTGGFSTAWVLVLMQLRTLLKQGKDEPK